MSDATPDPQSARDAQDAQKRAAAEAACALVESGMVVGLGTGSTAAHAVACLIRRVREEGLRIEGVPTSEHTARQAREGGIPLTDFGRVARIDLTIDGADEIAHGSLHLIKGLGGALLREKIVASASLREVIIADAGKLVDRLGTHAPLPVEITAFGWQATAAKLRRFDAQIRLRESNGAPFVTDGGNLVLDCRFAGIDDPAALEQSLRGVVGVIETGLFVGLATEAFVAHEGGVEHLEAR